MLVKAHKRQKISLRKLFVWGCCGLMLFAVTCIAQPVYYQIKAVLAQVLLENSWQKSQLIKNESFKPWPWADTWPSFELTLFDSHGNANNMIVLGNASGESLAFAPGLLTENTMPGNIGHSIVAAHRDTHFSLLKDYKVGQQMIVTDRNQKQLIFQVDQINIVDSQDESPILALEHSRLTLVTCFPFGSEAQNTSLRYLVSGFLKEK